MVSAWSRSARFCSALGPSTSPLLGPGAYFPCDVHCFRCASPDAPFLTRAAARPPLVPRAKLLVPSPNAYCPNLPHRIKGGESMGYTSKRARQTEVTEADKGRGPGTYSTHSPSCSTRNSPCGIRTCRAKDSECTCACWRGRLQRGRLAGQGKTPPSMPPKGARGYRPARGVCRAAAAPWEAVSLPPRPPPPGPLTYDVGAPEVNGVTLKYKGNFWSRLRAIRGKTRTPAVGPGPGDYQPPGRPRGALAKLEMEWEQERARRQAQAPLLRSADIAERRTRRENLPSPATYDLSECAEHRYFNSGAPPFFSGSRRFAKGLREGPGPADTHYRCSAMEALERLRSRAHAPFGSICGRTSIRRAGALYPGPAAYETERGMTWAARRRVERRGKAARLAAFGSRCARPIAVTVHLEQPCAPGPALYQQQKPPSRKQHATHAIFRSRTQRMPDTPRKWLADVGTYDWAGQANALFRPTSHLSRRARARCPFLQGGPHFHYPPVPKFPGPADYEPRVDSEVLHGALDTSPLHKLPPETPGPPHYHINRLYADTMVWPTLNRTLRNPVAREQPARPAIPRAQLVSQRKRLRCFLQCDGGGFLFPLKIQC